jgi:2-oxoglutarate ferredoxin oxidoreductase subunit beta
VPARDEITVDDYDEGTTQEVEMHDGSVVVLKKLEKEFDPTDRWQSFRVLEEAQRNNWLVTGLIFIEEKVPSLFDEYNIPDQLNRLSSDKLRPPKESMDKMNALLF